MRTGRDNESVIPAFYIQKPYRKPCEAFVISNALIITALHCLSTFRCEFAKAVINK